MIFAALVQVASSLPTDSSALERSISALERDVSALDSAINALGISSARWEPWVWVFSGLVVIGVLMEWWVIEYDWDDEMEEWAIWDCVGIRRSPSRPSIVKWRVEMASVFLIAIGVACETGVGVEISHINGLIRSKDAELRTKNAELRQMSDQLVTLLNGETEKLKADNLSLGAIVNPRRLTIDQQRTIAENCSKFSSLFAGKRIKLESYWLDTEAFVLAEQIVMALRMRPCGIMLDDDAMLIGPAGRNFTFGISVFGSDAELAKKIADAISRNGGTISAGFTNGVPDAGVMRFGRQNALPHEVTILVGPKMPNAETIKELNRITPPSH